MMYCERCNIDFTEGLRYCKWCGQTLFERRRHTSELMTCPTCATAIKPGWAFCKSCGGRLGSQEREVVNVYCPRCGTMNDHAAPSCSMCGEDLTQDRQEAQEPQEQASTSFMPGCPSCGESIDPGSTYCKGCGSPVYAQPGPFGDSALLCGVCNSYSPVGSTNCRVCNASLLPGAGLDATEPEPTEDKPRTLPDLADHLPDPQMDSGAGTRQFVSPAADVESGAHTIVFVESGDLAASQDDLPEDQKVTAVVEPKSGAKTSVLSGVAGAKSELPPPTAAFKKSRTTSPVEGQEGAGKSSTEAPAVRFRRDCPAFAGSARALRHATRSRQRRSPRGGSERAGPATSPQPETARLFLVLNPWSRRHFTPMPILRRRLKRLPR